MKDEIPGILLGLAFGVVIGMGLGATLEGIRNSRQIQRVLAGTETLELGGRLYLTLREEVARLRKG